MSDKNWFGLQRSQGASRGVHDKLGLLFAEVRSDGQTQDGVGKIFGDRKRAAAPFPASIGAREVWRDGIVYERADASLGELLLQRVAVAVADDEQMPNRLRPGGRSGQD